MNSTYAETIDPRPVVRTGRAIQQNPERPDDEGVPGEHLRLIALLNRFGFHPMSKQEAMKMAAELLATDWREA